MALDSVFVVLRDCLYINNVNRKINGDYCLVFGLNLSRFWFADLIGDWKNSDLLHCFM